MRVDEDAVAEVRLPASDPEGAPLTFTIGAPTHGTVTGTAPTLSYTPAPDFHGADSFMVTVSDGELTQSAVIHIEVASINDPPVAHDDARASAEDAAQQITPATLLANDEDVDGDTLTLTATEHPEHGTVEMIDGAIRFVPDADFVGEASFEYVVSDGTATDRGRVAIAVGGVNDPPVAAADTATTDEDTELVIPSSAVLGNDTDTEGQALQITAVTDGTGGTVRLSGGDITFTPTPDIAGPASFSYTVSDGAGTDVGTVTVTVAPINDAPVAFDDAVDTDEETGVYIAAETLVANDKDIDGPGMTITEVGGAVGGTVSLTGATVSFIPAPDVTGPASFTYVVSDGMDSDVGTVTVTVAPTNDAPVAGDDAIETDEDTAIDIAADALIANDTDVDGPSLTITAVGGAVGGTASLTGGTIRFTPTPDVAGPAGFTYTVSDGTTTDVGAVTVTVAPINDAPIAFDDAVTTDEDAAIDIAADTLTVNDTDIDGPSTTITAVGGAIGGTVSLTGGTIRFIPTPDASGAARFTYTVSDGTDSDVGTVAVTIASVNDAPVAVDDAIDTDEDTAFDVAADTLVANDTDVDGASMAIGSSLTITAVSGAVGGTAVLTGSSIRFIPTPDFAGPAGFTYTVSDGTDTDVGAVTVTVASINDAPVAVDDAASTDEDTAIDIAATTLVANDTDTDDPSLTITAVGSATGGTVSMTGATIRFTPTTDVSGTASFTYTVSDGTATDVGTVTITVAPINDAPVAVDDAITTDEDTAVDIAAGALTANDTDVDDASITVTAVGSATGGTVSLAGGVIRFTPTPDATGPAGFTYTVSDGTATDVGAVAVTVTPTNDAPIAVADATTTAEDTALDIAAATLMANDTDVDGPSLTITAVGGAIGGTVTLTGGTIRFIPTPDVAGAAGFTYTVSDGSATDVGVVTVTVAPVNDAPIAADDATSTTVNTPVTVTAAALLANDGDPEGDTLTVTAVADASHGTVALASGDVTFTPAPGFAGSASFSYTIEDPAGATATALVAVTVTGVCGDGVASAGEGCDDGNAVDGDGCTHACVDEVCGDGVVNDAQARAPTALTITWLATSCGAGSTLTIEIDGQPALVTVGDTGTCGCTPGVRTETVTDPTVLALLIDGSNPVHVTMPGGMLAWVTMAPTVEGVAQEVVLFDTAPTGDAEARTADACAAGFVTDPDVTTTATFDLIASEACDDGDDTDPLDGCHACTLARCGDGVAQHTEVCDDGNAVGGDGCRADCQGDEVCGDQQVDGAAGEQCDDGDDTDPLDGCNACRLPACGDGAQQVGEVCDDGNTAYDDGCRGDCNGLEVCGDGFIDFAAGEQCDDGDDTDPADGCHGCALGTIADVAPQIVSGALSCNTNTSNTGRKIASDGVANFFVVMNCGGTAWTNASTDRGATWGTPVNTGLTGVSEVAIEGGGPLGMVYVATVTGGRLKFARSLDAGATWEAAQDLAAASDNEVSIDALGDSIYIGVSTGSAIEVFHNGALGDPAGWTSVNVAQSNVFHDVIIDKISGAVVAASDDPSFHLRISTDGGATFGAETAPAGTAFFSDWTASNGSLYVAGTGGGSDLATVIPLSAPATSSSVSGLPTMSTSQARAIDADPLGNAYVASQLDSGVIQLDRIQHGASAVVASDIRTFGTGSYPGVAALPNSSGAVVIYGAGTQVWAAVEGY